MGEKYKTEDPMFTRQKLASILIKGLDRALTEQEIKTIYILGDCDHETKGVLLSLLEELAARVDYFKEED
ncbi:hypothetical protein [Niallia circulans]|uniref:Uncharacterized protein n=1 Tax=Niallia circulans TaxID=1397 RepID=A0A941GKK1_NIACI|nr:hypothetical protein [Niallia circulans]MCB5238914.1 hypothetical protein [Niallia circulans]